MRIEKPKKIDSLDIVAIWCTLFTVKSVIIGTPREVLLINLFLLLLYIEVKFNNKNKKKKK